MAVLILLFIRNPISPPSDALFFPAHVYPFTLTFSLSFRLVSVIANMSHFVSNRISLMLFVLDLIPLMLEYIIFNIFEVFCLFDLLVRLFFWFLLHFIMLLLKIFVSACWSWLFVTFLWLIPILLIGLVVLSVLLVDCSFMFLSCWGSSFFVVAVVLWSVSC